VTVEPLTTVLWYLKDQEPNKARITIYIKNWKLAFAVVVSICVVVVDFWKVLLYEYAVVAVGFEVSVKGLELVLALDVDMVSGSIHWSSLEGADDNDSIVVVVLEVVTQLVVVVVLASIIIVVVGLVLLSSIFFLQRVIAPVLLNSFPINGGWSWTYSALINMNIFWKLFLTFLN
jgi:hypothetical protein